MNEIGISLFLYINILRDFAITCYRIGYILYLLHIHFFFLCLTSFFIQLRHTAETCDLLNDFCVKQFFVSPINNDVNIHSIDYRSVFNRTRTYTLMWEESKIFHVFVLFSQEIRKKAQKYLFLALSVSILQHNQDTAIIKIIQVCFLLLAFDVI